MPPTTARKTVHGATLVTSSLSPSARSRSSPRLLTPKPATRSGKRRTVLIGCRPSCRDCSGTGKQSASAIYAKVSSDNCTNSTTKRLARRHLHEQSPTRAAAEVRPHFLPFAARSYSARSAPSLPACAPRASLCLHVHSARSALFADLVNLGRPVAFSVSPGRVYTARCPANSAAVSPRHKGLHVRDDPGPPALTAPNRSSVPGFLPPPPPPRRSGASSSAFSSGAACRSAHGQTGAGTVRHRPGPARQSAHLDEHDRDHAQEAAAHRGQLRRQRPFVRARLRPPAQLHVSADGTIGSINNHCAIALSSATGTSHVGRSAGCHRTPAWQRRTRYPRYGAPHTTAALSSSPRVGAIPDHARHIPRPLAALVGIRRSLRKPEQDQAKRGCR